MIRDELISGSIGTALSAVGTGLQTNEVLQTISLVITIIGGLITFIIVPFINWYRKAKKDGKIDKEELKDGINIIGEGSEKVKEEAEKHKYEEEDLVAHAIEIEEENKDKEE